MAEPSTYQSLYRRYRSQRFDQVLGQDHITNALRNAVRDGRVGHAYLFSGPRGTGKTSTARILAKVLNCDAPEDGEPCGKCESCLTVERGQDIDWLLEQDAASKSKVDDMRDLLDRVPLGTSGRRKVIILDEVHMLSQGAENALLKTLEEPPSHVVFVLATTDPQKVRPTIRSRTQHFEFHLLSSSVIGEHVRHVIADAALPLPADRIDSVVDHVVRAGGGSARDTLSALDQVAALGEVVDGNEPVDAILDALVAGDTGGVLVAVAEAVGSGREPRTLGEALVARLRDSFLAVMGAADDQLTPDQLERATALGKALGPARLTRALEVLGEALTELARKPDPRIVVEVALVRLTRPDTDTSLQALADRVAQLERLLESGAVAPAASSGSAEPAAGDPDPAPSADPAPAGDLDPAPSADPAPAGDLDPAPSAEAAPAAEAAAPATPRSPAPPAAAPAPSGGGGQADAARAVLARTRQEAGPADTGTGQPAQGRGGLSALAAAAAPANAPNEAAPPTGAVIAEPAAEAAGEAPPSPAGAGSDPAAAPAASAPSQPGPTPTEPDPTASAPAAPAAGAEPAGAPSAGPLPSLSELDSAWSSAVLGELPISVRSKWRGGRWQEVADDTARFAVPNEWHKKACDEGLRDVEQALVDHFGNRVPVEVVVEGGGSGAGAPAGGAASAGPSNGSGGGAGGAGGGEPAFSPAGEEPDEVEAFDPGEIGRIDELEDATDVVTNGVELLKQTFGGELITVDQTG